jgi:hypothetical protein
MKAPQSLSNSTMIKNHVQQVHWLYSSSYYDQGRHRLNSTITMIRSIIVQVALQAPQWGIKLEIRNSNIKVLLATSKGLKEHLLASCKIIKNHVNTSRQSMNHDIK